MPDSHCRWFLIRGSRILELLPRYTISAYILARGSRKEHWAAGVPPCSEPGLVSYSTCCYFIEEWVEFLIDPGYWMLALCTRIIAKSKYLCYLIVDLEPCCTASVRAEGRFLAGEAVRWVLPVLPSAFLFSWRVLEPAEKDTRQGNIFWLGYTGIIMPDVIAPVWPV